MEHIEDLVGQLLADVDALQHPAATPEQVDCFEQKLGVQLPVGLKLLLQKSNGGEFVTCRMDTPFIPEDIESCEPASLWSSHQEVLEARGFPPAGPDLYLPLGDDYSGEVIALDLRTETYGQIFCTFDSSESIDDISVEGKDFADWVARSLEGFSKERAKEQERREKPRLESRPVPEKLQGMEAHIRHVLAADFRINESFFLESAIHPPGVWVEATFEKHNAFWLGFDHVERRLDELAGVALKTGADYCVFVWDGSELKKETFLNVTLASERCNEMQPKVCDDPFDFESVKLSKESPQLLIMETTTRQYLEPVPTNAKSVVVCAVRDGFYHRLSFHLTNFATAQHVSPIIDKLLSYGFRWIPAK